MVFSTHRGVLFGQHALVADGLGLRVLERDVAPLALVAVEHLLTGLAPQDAHELVGEVERIVHAAVHPHGADRRVHVRGIARQDRAPDAEFLGHALVHDVEIAAANIVVGVLRQERLEPRLQRVRPLQRVWIVVGAGREVHAPAVRRTLPVKQV